MSTAELATRRLDHREGSYFRSINLEPRNWIAPQLIKCGFRDDRVTVVNADGTVRTMTVPRGLDSGWGELVASEVNVKAGELTLVLDSGDRIQVDLGWPSKGPRFRGAPVIYLDQNQWVNLPKARYAAEQLDASTLCAAEELMALAEAGKVGLPYSSGRLVETAPRGKQRRDMALTMLHLSRGLQMRNPLRVRRRELVAALSGKDPRCPETFTHDSEALFSAESPVPPPEDFPAFFVELHRRMTAVTATVAGMIEDDEPEDDKGAAARSRWLNVYQALARQVHAEQLSPEKTRTVAHRATMKDLSVEIEEAGSEVGIGEDALTDWIEKRAFEDIESAPHIATLREMLYHRLRSRDDHWESNDLIDMQFLSCAGGYADFVVAENKFSHYLGRIQRRFPANATSVSKLPELIEALRETSGLE